MEKLVKETRMNANPAAVPLTTHDVSRYLHVDLTTVINWCEMFGRKKAQWQAGWREGCGGELAHGSAARRTSSVLVRSRAV